MLMTVQLAQELMECIDTIEHLGDYFPPFPEGMYSRHLRVLNKIAAFNLKTEHPLPSDISEMMNVTRPGVTRTLKELEEMGYIERQVDRLDKRMSRLMLTQKGWKIYTDYSEACHTDLIRVLEDMDEKQIQEAVDVWNQIISRILKMAENMHRNV